MTTPTPEELLAQWLDDPAAGPPQGLEDEVVQAMIALRPELAPEPTISLDDILAGVTEGPFARRSEAPVSQTISDEELEARRSEMPVSQAEIVDLAAARKRRNRIWGAVGTMAAAALVLFVVIPDGDTFSESEELSAPTAQEVLNDAPMKQEGVNPAAPLEEAAEAEEEAPGVARQAPPAAPKPVADGTLGRELKAAEGRGSSYGPPPEAEPSPEPAEDLEPADVQVADNRISSGDADAYEAAPSATAGWDELDDEADYRYGEADVAETTVSKSARTESRTRSPSSRPSAGLFGGNRDQKSAAPEMVEAEAEEDALADFSYEEEPQAKKEQPTDLDGLRAAAAPRDYDPNWYLRVLDGAALDDFAATIDTAEARAAEGDYAGAALACRQLADNTSDPRVRQDMYGRAAAFSGSLTDVRKGQKVSSANTAFLARLYALEGQLLEAQGDVEGAKQAYRTAANLNAAR